MLTYNLFWWNLFGVRAGNGGSAGKLINASGPFDIMGFQECESVQRVLDDAGLRESHIGVQGPHALGLAYRKDTWEVLAKGEQAVAEDRPEQNYGLRGVQWVRLRHLTSGHIVFFLNHHGPLPINTGGICAGRATASNMLKVVGQNMQLDDRAVIVGDLNADATSETQTTFQERIDRVIEHWVDAVYYSCDSISSINLGNGGSDHQALAATLPL